MGWGDKFKRAVKNADGSPKRLGGTAHVLSTEPLVVRDSQGRELGLGDEVVVLQPGSLARIAKMEAFVAPGAPPNLMQILLVSSTNLVVPRGAQLDGILRTAKYAELQAADQQEHGGAQQGTPGDAPAEAPAAPAIHLTDAPPSPLDPRD